MKKVRVSIVLALVLTLLSAVDAPAGPMLDRILEKGVLMVGTSGDQPPLTAKSTEGKIIGFDADLATYMATAMGVKLKLVPMAFSELLPALEAGKTDMILSGMTITPRRNLKVAFVGPYYISGKGILTKVQTITSVKDATEINQPDFTLVALKGSTSQAFVEQVISRAKIVTTKTLDEALELLFEDKADALIADYPYCAVSALRYREKGLAAGEAALTFEPLGIAVPGNDPLLINWVQNILTILKGNGALKELKKRWFQPGDWLKELQ